MADETIAARVSRLLPEVLSIYAREHGDAALRETDLRTVREVEAVWSEVVGRVFAKVDQDFEAVEPAWRKVMDVDPTTSPIDLFSPLGQARRETLHTQALAFLLDAARSHGLGSAPLGRLLMLLRPSAPQVCALALQVLEDGSAAVVVEAERAAGNAAESEHGSSRTDLWIELPTTAGWIIIVIEIKIDAEVETAQLSRYDRILEGRAAELGTELTLKVLLTLDGLHSGDWIGLSHLQLAAALGGLITDVADQGHQWLRLYLATILRELYGVVWRESLTRKEKARYVPYLKARFKEFT